MRVDSARISADTRRARCGATREEDTMLGYIFCRLCGAPIVAWSEDDLCGECRDVRHGIQIGRHLYARRAA